MEILGKVRPEEVIAQWVVREYDKIKVRPDAPPLDPALLTDIDYSDREKHKQRLAFLLCCREPVLNVFLEDLEWYKVQVELEDLKSLRVIRESGWIPLSGKGGKIASAVDNYIKFDNDPSTAPAVADTETKKEFEGLLTSIRDFREQAGNAGHNLTLILIGPSTKGPFTLLEGNHTAMALFLRHFIDHPEAPYPSRISYAGISPLIQRCGWAWVDS